MIIVTSKPIEIDWTTVYAVHLLGDVNQVIPWYVMKYGKGYLPCLPFIPQEEGQYGNSLSHRAHLVRQAINGQRWMEDLSDELRSLLQQYPLSEMSCVGDDPPYPEDLYRFISQIQ